MNLIADIGATQTRCAVLDDDGRIQAAEVFRNRRFDSLQALLRGYLGRCPDRPDSAALAVAAPVLGDGVRMPNLEWSFSRGSLAGELDLRELVVVNDFAAVAWALPALAGAGLNKEGGGGADLHKVGGGAPVAGTAMATLGPGSGLGVASVAPCGGEWAVVEGEGGNISFSGVTPEQQSITDHIRAQDGHCSAESLLSGPGLVNIYMALAELQGQGVTRPSPAQVSRAAADGDALAAEARGMFFEFLGTVAGNLALTVGARGGVFIAGGIVPRMLEPLERSRFRDSFAAKGRYRFYLEAIPTYVITEPYPAFLGLRRLLGYG